MFRFWKRRPRTLVIGKEMANAGAAEQQRLANPPGMPSPMPAATYGYDDGYLAFLNPTPLALDSELTELCRRMAVIEPSARARVRQSISMDEFYTLLTFSRRMALFALRERSVGRLRDGLNAIALIDLARIDYRDVPMVVALLRHAAQRIGADVGALLSDTSAMSEPEIARFLSEFAKRRLGEKELRDMTGWQEVTTRYGVGFVGYGFRPYEPTVDLLAALIDIAALFAADRYRPGGMQVGTELPPVWLRAAGEATVAKALRGVRGAASFSAFIRPELHPADDSQSILVFLVELPDTERARMLQELSRTANHSTHSLLGCAADRLFCLVVAQSILRDVESIETPTSLVRFEPGVVAALRQALAG